MTESDSATWAALGAAGLAALFFAAAVVLLVRWRRAAARESADVREASRRTEDLVAELRGALAAAGGDGDRPDLHDEIGFTLDLDEALGRALRAAVRLLGASAALIALARKGGEPIVASYGLTAEESARELVALPPESGGARAVRLDYLYGEDDPAGDEFRIGGGLAVRLFDEEGGRVGTLGLFWRRDGDAITEEAVARAEELASAFGPALENAFRFAEVRRLADTDTLTGLKSRRYFRERLARECVRAHRYGRGLALLLFDLRTVESPHSLADAGERIENVVRASDVACYLGEGVFAVILPESGRLDADRLYRRLQFSLGARVDSPSERLRLVAAAAELGPGDDPESLYRRAQQLLESAREPAQASAR
jgi:diguanylate cyclase (GGDEF)-like protein